MSQSSGYSGRLADRTGVDAGPRWENAVGLVALERASWLGVLERQAEWLSLPLKGAAHGGMTGSSLTTIAGSTAALKWDPPLIQLRDWLSNYRLSIIILFLFFSFFQSCGGRELQSREMGMTGVWAAEAACHLTCVGSGIISCPLLSGACWDHGVFEPLLWSWADRRHGMLRETPAC